MRQEVKMTGQNQGRTITPANEVTWDLHWDLQLWYASAGIWVPLSHVYYSTCYVVSLSESVVLRLILVRAGKCPRPCFSHSSELSSLPVGSLAGERRLMSSPSLLATSGKGRVLPCSGFERNVRKMFRAVNLVGNNQTRHIHSRVWKKSLSQLACAQYSLYCCSGCRYLLGHALSLKKRPALA